VDDPWDWYLENLVIGNLIIGLVFVPIVIYGIWLAIKSTMDEGKSSQAGEKRFCTNCGQKLKKDAKYCRNCGFKITR